LLLRRGHGETGVSNNLTIEVRLSFLTREPGVGTRSKFILPAVERPPTQQSASGPTLETGGSDDSARRGRDVRAVAPITLQLHGSPHTRRADGEQALRIAGSTPRPHRSRVHGCRDAESQRLGSLIA